MPRKLEIWEEAVEKFGADEFKFYNGLTDRELIIVGCSVIDLGIAGLLEKRLIHNSKEIELFLGLNEDGRAPAGSFGARIQLAFLLGILSLEEIAALRMLKKIRNRFAHRISATYQDKEVASPIDELSLWVISSIAVFNAQDKKQQAAIVEDLGNKKYPKRNRVNIIFSFAVFGYIIKERLQAIQPVEAMPHGIR